MQHLLILVIALVIIGLTFTVTKWPGGMHMTFSQHAATSRWSKIYYALLFLATLPLLMWFFFDWFVPNRSLPHAFLWFAGVAIVFQIICTWVPEEGGMKTKVHRSLTGISGIALLPLVIMIATAATLSTPVRVTAWIGLATMVVLLMIALRNQKGFRWALPLQAGYYAVFFIILLAATYV